jgi:outer membrane protein OmpA-like peptidoglycan-associated protein
MKKSHLILSSVFCVLAFAARPASAYVYLYHPGAPAVTVDPTVLGEPPAPDQQEMPAPVHAAATHSFDTDETVDAAPVAPVETTQAPSTPAPIPHRLPKPFFTSTSIAPPVAQTPPPPAAMVQEDVVPVASVSPPAPQPALVPVERKNRIVDDGPDDRPAAEAAPAEDTASAVPEMADLTINFDSTSSTLPQPEQKKLDDLARQLTDAPAMRIQIRGYAKGDASDASSARRMALARALNVRSYLMDKGIKPVRLDVRALGSETDKMPIDRVDMVFVR